MEASIQRVCPEGLGSQRPEQPLLQKPSYNKAVKGLESENKFQACIKKPAYGRLLVD